MKKVVLFDLDGTLLPMDLNKFLEAYFVTLVKKLAALGLPAATAEEQKALGKAVWAGTYAMMANDGSCTNEQRFFDTFKQLTGVDLSLMRPELDSFYRNEFHQIKQVCGFDPKVRETVDKIKANGARVAVATNPFFPLLANEARLSWAGLSLSDFEYCTCYENSSYCKPSLKYYAAVLDHLGVRAEDCVMVGNDVREDMVARELGMDVFLLTACIINPDGKDVNDYPHGDLDDLLRYLDTL